MRHLPHQGRKRQSLAHLLGAHHARRLGRSHQAHGPAERPGADAGGSSHHREVSEHLSRPGARRSQAGDVHGRASHSWTKRIPNETVRGTCCNCHALGRALSWRRSKEDWKLLTNMHAAFFPQADARLPCGAFGRQRRAPAARRTRRLRGSGCRAGRVPRRMRRSTSWRKTTPLHTPEWAAWRARMRAPKLAGRWLVSAYITGPRQICRRNGDRAGRGAKTNSRPRVKLHVREGRLHAHAHRARRLVYTGYSWRGRSPRRAGMPPAPTPDDLPSEMREVMWIAPDQIDAEGRWFWGAYQEFGFDVKMQRATDGPIAARHGSSRRSRPARQASASSSSATIFRPTRRGGSRFRQRGHGEAHRLAYRLGDRRRSGRRRRRGLRQARCGLSGARCCTSAIAVYDKHRLHQGVAANPRSRGWAARRIPKGYQQFEAIAYQRGADGKPNTADDVELGPVDVELVGGRVLCRLRRRRQGVRRHLEPYWILHAGARRPESASANSAATITATSGWWRRPKTRRTRTASR